MKATTVARPPVPDGAETMTVGIAPAVATDAGDVVVPGPITVTVVLDSCGTVLATVVVGDNVVVVVVVVEVVVVVVAAAAVNELLDCECPLRSVRTKTPTVSPGSTPVTVTTSLVRLIEPRLTERKYV
jgi:hypothetical protein